MAKQYSKLIIREEFVKLLNEKPFNKISITELVKNCELNRNTFYYYYSDIYAVLTEVFEDELAKITSGYYDGKTWNDTLLQATHFARENKRAVFHVYHSMQREELEKFLYTFVERILKKFIDDECAGMAVDDFDEALVVKFFQMALTGMLIEWISDGMKQDIDFIIARMSLLLEGNIKNILENSQGLKREWRDIF